MLRVVEQGVDEVLPFVVEPAGGPVDDGEEDVKADEEEGVDEMMDAHRSPRQQKI